MKLTVTQENLSRALQIVGRVATERTALPILNNILMRTDGNRLQLLATNLELAINHHIGGKVEREGVVTVPAKLMSEFVSNLPKENVTLESDGAKLKITCGAYKSTINGMLPDEFPEMPKISEKQTVTLGAAEVKRAIQQTVGVTSNDDTRPVLTGIYCHSFEGKLYFAATDGYRLAERRLGDYDSKVDAIIPAMALNDVIRVMNDDTLEAKFMFDENQMRILLDDTEITSRLIEGKFPDYRQLIPKSSETTVIVAKDAFTRITKVASLFARDSGGGITLKAESENGKLSVHSVASQLGENTSEAEAQINADGQVTLNSRYLMEALSCVDEQKVEFGFSGKLAPCVLTAGGNKADYKHVIMPLRS